MSTNRSIGRSASTHENDPSAVKPRKARSANLCAFTFADGRQCRTPRRSGHLHLCYFHAQKEAASLAAKQAGEAISSFFYGNYLSAGDLSAALGRVFSAVAEGHIKPKAATALAYLGQTLNQSVKLAQDEYVNVYGGDVWRRKVASYLEPPPPPPQRPPQPAPMPQLNPPSAPEPTSQLAQTAVNCRSSLATQHSPLPQVSHSAETPANGHSPLVTDHSPLPQSPHTPLPPTSTEFAQQVLAGLPTGSLPPTPHVQPAPLNRQPAETPTNCHSEPAARREEPAFSSSSAPSTTPTPAPQPTSPQPSQPTHNSQPAPTPPAPTPVNCHSSLACPPRRATHRSPLPHNPPPVPPGFGAPANWDALIPPKPRRRFSRHWQLPD